MRASGVSGVSGVSSISSVTIAAKRTLERFSGLEALRLRSLRVDKL